MANRLIRIATRDEGNYRSTLDQSKTRKTFEYDGETFTLRGDEMLSVPDYVATAWVTHDSNMEVVTDPKA